MGASLVEFLNRLFPVHDGSFIAFLNQFDSGLVVIFAGLIGGVCAVGYDIVTGQYKRSSLWYLLLAFVVALINELFDSLPGNGDKFLGSCLAGLGAVSVVGQFIGLRQSDTAVNANAIQLYESMQKKELILHRLESLSKLVNNLNLPPNSGQILSDAIADLRQEIQQ